MLDSNPDCTAKGIPARLHTCGRLADHLFADSEALFLRHKPLNHDEVYVAQIPEHVEDQSVNRGKYSESPTDVLYDTKGGHHHLHLMIAKLTVGEVQRFRSTVLDEDKNIAVYTVKAVHVPAPCMYPHSEIQLQQDGKRFDRKNAPRTVKTNLRYEMAKNANIYLDSMRRVKAPPGFGAKPA